MQRGSTENEPRYPGDQEAAGPLVVSLAEREKLKRVRRGECPECGTRLFHKMSLGRKGAPLNEEGKCQNGRCLVCSPLQKPGDDSNKEKPKVPQVVECVNSSWMSTTGRIPESSDQAFGMFQNAEDDNMSVITLDKRLLNSESQSGSVRSLVGSRRALLRAKSSTRDIIEEQDPISSESDEMEGDILARMAMLLDVDSESFTPSNEVVAGGGSNEDNFLQNVGDVSPSKMNKSRAERIVSEQALSQRSIAGTTTTSPRKPFRPPAVFVPPIVEEVRLNDDPQEIVLDGPLENPVRKTRISGRQSPAMVGETQPSSDHVVEVPLKGDNTLKLPRESMVTKGPLATEVDGPVFPSSVAVMEVPLKDDATTQHHVSVMEVPVKKDTRASAPPCSNMSQGTVKKEPGDLPVPSSLAKVMQVPLKDDDEPTRTLEDIERHSFRSFRTDNAKHSESSGGGPFRNGDPIEEYNEYSSKLLEMLENYIEPDNVDEVALKKPPPTTRETSSSTATGKSESLPDGDAMVSRISVSKVSISKERIPKKSPGRKKPPPSRSPRSPRSPVSDLNLELNHPASNDLVLLLGRLEHGRSDDHAAALIQLSDLVWDHGQAAKDDFVANGGTQLLTTIMWSDMAQPDSEEAACEVFLSLTATTPSSGKLSDIHTVDDKFLSDPHLEGLLDALLIVMQTFLSNRSIQQTACRILACLAANRNEVDGTRSGACLAVLNAMEAHMSSIILHEWGMRTLFNQCVYSRHSETNKRTLLTTQLETTGLSGSSFLERTLLQSMSQEDQLELGPGSLLEWVCRLCWCLLASSEAVADLVVLRIDTIRKLLHVLEACRTTNGASSELQEAVLGILANRVQHTQYSSFLATADVLLLVLDVMHENKTSLGVQVEACYLFANVTMRLDATEKERLVSFGSVRTLVGAMFAFPNEKRSLQEPCLRAIVGLSLDSEAAKETICEPDTLSVLLQLCKIDDSSLPQQQELLCSLLASLYASPRLHPNALAFESFRAVAVAAVKYINSEKLQDSACSAYRNLTANPETLSLLRHTGIERLVVSSMDAFRMAKSVQLNGCHALLQMCLENDYYDRPLSEAGAIDAVVAAIQTHLDSQDVLESACEALWGLIHSSNTLGHQFLSHETAVETVTCIFVMHPSSVSLVETACGILAFASSSVSLSTSTPVLTEGVSHVVEAIRRYPDNDGILINGTYFLRRALVRSSSFITEFRDVIPFIVDALRDSQQTDLFIKEACSFLGFAAHVSYDAKSHILSLETHSLLLTIMEFRGGSEVVNQAVSEALTELSHDQGGYSSHY